MTAQKKDEAFVSASKEGFLEEVQFHLNLKGWVRFWMVKMKRERHFEERECYEQRRRDGKAQGTYRNNTRTS